MTEETQVRVATLKSWTTAIFNETGQPLLTVETFDGQQLNMFLTPQAAIELGAALQDTGNKTLKSTN